MSRNDVSSADLLYFLCHIKRCKENSIKLTKNIFRGFNYLYTLIEGINQMIKPLTTNLNQKYSTTNKMPHYNQSFGINLDVEDGVFGIRHDSKIIDALSENFEFTDATISIRNKGAKTFEINKCFDSFNSQVVAESASPESIIKALIKGITELL